MAKSFKGGIHPPYHKELTKNKQIRPCPAPKEVVIPLSQHTGAACSPLVAVGDAVKVGQKIGDSDQFISAPVHSPVSGTVKALERRPYPSGAKVMAVVIESDGQNTMHESIAPLPNPAKLSKAALLKIIREAGMVGLGGAAFPTAVKLSPPPQKKITYIIINGAECEPYLTADHRLMLEEPEDVVAGTKAIMLTAGATESIIAIEDNQSAAIKVMEKTLKNEPKIKLAVLKTKYPQGGEKQLIKALLNLEVPSGGLPLDVGVIVNNAGTAVQISRTLSTGLPLIDRVVTVTGNGVKNPANLRIKLGTSLRFALEQCGGLKEEAGKVLLGGPMMGLAQSSLDIPLIKSSNAILVLTQKEAIELEDAPCIRCSRCVEACPIHLMPNFLADAGQNGNWRKAEALKVKDCIECGCCSYVCPSERLLVQYLKAAKDALQKNNI